MTDDESLRRRHLAAFRALLPEHLARSSWSRERLVVEREQRLRVLLATAQEHSRWHRERLAGIDPDHVTEADLSRIPTMTKAEMMDHLDDAFTDPRLTRDVVESHLRTQAAESYLLDEYQVFLSSGSSGERGLFVWDWKGWLSFNLVLARSWLRERATAGLAAGAVEAVVASTGPNVTTASTFQPPTMPVVFLSARSPIAGVVHALNEVRPGILRGYPTMLAVLAAESRAGRLRIEPRIVRSHSEPLLPEMRRAIEATFGVPVSNTYGTTEGAAATGCGKGRGMHLNDDVCLIELVDAEGRPIGPGERSAKVYVTNLMNLVQPLIRYELPDEMTWIDEPCPCGSPMRRVEDIVGRTADVFVYANGVAVHPSVFRFVLHSEASVFSYQVLQTARGATVRIQTTGAVDTRAVAERIRQALARAGLDEPVVTVNDRKPIEQLPSGKTRRFVPLEPLR